MSATDLTAPAPSEASPSPGGALVSVILAINEAEAHPREVIEGFGKALHDAGYASEFVIVLDGPVGRFEEELRELGKRWEVHVVALEGGGLGESS